MVDEIAQLSPQSAEDQWRSGLPIRPGKSGGMAAGELALDEASQNHKGHNFRSVYPASARTQRKLNEASESPLRDKLL